MPSRREFIHESLAASALVAGGFRASSIFAAQSPVEPSPIVIYDPKTGGAPRFAAAAVRLGMPVHAIGQELGSFWMNVLEPMLRRTAFDGALAIAGRTSAASAFTLELLAADYGLRPVYRTLHSSGESLAHWTAAARAVSTAKPLYALPALEPLDLAAVGSQTVHSWLLVRAAPSLRGQIAA